MSAEKYEPWEIVERDGNEMMKTMWRSLARLDKAQKEDLVKTRVYDLDTGLFKHCFKDPWSIKDITRMHQASEKILAIATVNLFFDPLLFFYFSPEVKLMDLYDALIKDFKTEKFEHVFELTHLEYREQWDSLFQKLREYKTLYHKALVKEEYEHTKDEPWAIIERDGTQVMKDMLKAIIESPQKFFNGYKGPSLNFSKMSPTGKHSAIARCFPDAGEVVRTYGFDVSTETVLAITTVHLFFDTNFVFGPEVSLQSFYDALVQDFEIEKDKTRWDDWKFSNVAKISVGGGMGFSKDTLASEIREYFFLLKNLRSMSPVVSFAKGIN